MRVLIAAASRHGTTAEMAEFLGAALRSRHVDAVVADAGAVEDVAAYDAVVIGSGVYVGHWLAPAKDLIRRCGHQLQTRPVWLFSSGPLGDPPKPIEEPVDVAHLVEMSGARQHRIFAGCLNRALLGAAERTMVRVVKAPEGDFREWDALDAWAEEIAVALLWAPVHAD
jgi:menaquinone-dependent protoporphyrinogen oxidase